MKKRSIAALAFVVMIACNNRGDDTKATDSTNINTKTSSPADGGPNNGLGDTTNYNRETDTLVRDSSHQK